jgi:hypothetical protein
MSTNLVKQHNTSADSIQAFIDFNRTDQPKYQHVQIINTIKRLQPINSRQLARETGIERGAVCRVLDHVINTADPIIKKFNKKCPITGKTVSFYAEVEYILDEK